MRHNLTTEQYRQLAKAYTAGATLADLAEEMQVTIPTMSKWVVKGGAAVRSRGRTRVNGTPAQKAPVPAAPVAPEVEVSGRTILEIA